MAVGLFNLPQLGGMLADPDWFTPSEEKIAAVWEKAHFITWEFELEGFRLDCFGALIRRRDHGDRKSPFGWEIDHVVATARGGSDGYSNLRPLYWETNVKKSDGMLPLRYKWDTQLTRNVQVW